MLINLRNALMTGKRLPYDAEVEYLESTGTQYINTGLNYFADFEIGIKLRESVPNVALGISSRRCMERINASNPCWRLMIDGVTWGSSARITDYHIMSWKNGVFAADGVTAQTVSNSFPSGTMTIFGAGGSYYPNMIYACKLWDAQGNLVRDYIPVRKGTVGYLYDRVSGRLFGNAGTGDFVIGQDVVPVEYIESHGTEYINTGYSSTGVGIGAKVSCEKTTSTTSEMSIVGRNSSDGFDLYFLGGKCRLWNKSGGSITSDVAIVADTRYSINAAVHSSGGSLSVNGESKTLSFSPATPSAANIVIFRHNNRYYFVGKIYDCELHDNDVLVRNFLPVRVGSGSTWEGAMMDVLTRRIYRNAGTGAFTYGNDLKYPIPA